MLLPESLPFVLPEVHFAAVARPHPATPGNPSRVSRLYDHQLLYALNGGWVVIEGQDYELLADRVFFMLPRTARFYRMVLPQEAISITFDWTPEPPEKRLHFCQQADEITPAIEWLWREPRPIPDWDLQEMPFLDLATRPRVRHLLEEIIAAYARDDDLSRTQAASILVTAILQIQQEARLLRLISRYEGIAPHAVRRVQHAREVLESQQGLRLSIHEAAAQAGWSAGHFRRTFHAVFDSSPQDVQNTARVRRAAELLQAGVLSISEIAFECGFNDATYFSRAFKKQMGVPPREFQRAARHPRG